MADACASSRQAAAGKQLAPHRPWRAPEQQGSQNRGKKSYQAIRDSVGTTNNHVWDPEGPCPGAKVVHAPEWPCPGRAPGGAPSGPEMARNGPKSPKTGLGASVGWPVHVRQKGVQNGSKISFSKNDTGLFGVSLDVLLARSEAPLNRYDPHRVGCFTYPQCAFQTMYALQKEVNGVKWCCTKRRETHPLQLGPNTKS